MYQLCAPLTLLGSGSGASKPWPAAWIWDYPNRCKWWLKRMGSYSCPSMAVGHWGWGGARWNLHIWEHWIREHQILSGDGAIAEEDHLSLLLVSSLEVSDWRLWRNKILNIYWLWLLRQLQLLIGKSALATVIRAAVTSRLNYCSNNKIQRLHSVFWECQVLHLSGRWES